MLRWSSVKRKQHLQQRLSGERCIYEDRVASIPRQSIAVAARNTRGLGPRAMSVSGGGQTVETGEYGSVIASGPDGARQHPPPLVRLHSTDGPGAAVKNFRGRPTAAEYSPLNQNEVIKKRSAPLAITESDSLEPIAVIRTSAKTLKVVRNASCDEEPLKEKDGGANASLLASPVTNTSSLDGITVASGITVGAMSNLARLARRRRSSVARDRWANKLEFLLAVIGYAVDLGNIWRFPSICYKYGGGAFLIPYLVMLFLGGLPMFYMELALGQFHKSGCISIWRKICPMFKGIGYGICFICTYIACFYNAIIAHAVYFVFSSLSSEVPWKDCGQWWNTDLCSSDLNATLSKHGEKLRTPSEEFFLFNVLEVNKSTGFDDLRGIKPGLAFCLLIVFLLVYFALWKGPKSSGKMVWVTATAPYFVLTVLLIRGVTLPGAAKGISYYLTPNFSRLSDPEVWSAAATQIFFSLGPGFGVLLALSSYNDFNNNCHRDALVTSFINCFTSFLSGFVIFSTLGYMSELTNKDVSEVVGDHDASLIFIVYPQAIATMSYSSVWGFIFFVMLITLGIDSTFSGIEALITGFCDEYPRILGRHREIFVGFVCTCYFFGSLPAVSYGGNYVIPWLDEYGVSLSVLFVVMCEMVAVCWFYGIGRFSEDIREMLGFYPGIYWRFCWTVCPIFIAGIFAITLYNTPFSPLSLPGYTYPEWSVPLGWFLRLTSVMSVPIFAIYMLCNTPGTFRQRLKMAITAQQRHPSMISSAPSLGGDPQPSAHVMDSSLLSNSPGTMAAV